MFKKTDYMLAQEEKLKELRIQIIRKINAKTSELEETKIGWFSRLDRSKQEQINALKKLAESITTNNLPNKSFASHIEDIRNQHPKVLSEPSIKRMLDDFINEETIIKVSGLEQRKGPKKLEDLLFFHDKIDSNEAARRLESKPPGSFLVRLSPTDSAYYIVYKTEGDKNIQFKIKNPESAARNFGYSDPGLKLGLGKGSLSHPVSKEDYENKIELKPKR